MITDIHFFIQTHLGYILTDLQSLCSSTRRSLHATTSLPLLVASSVPTPTPTSSLCSSPGITNGPHHFKSPSARKSSCGFPSVHIRMHPTIKPPPRSRHSSVVVSTRYSVSISVNANPNGLEILGIHTPGEVLTGFLSRFDLELIEVHLIVA